METPNRRQSDFDKKELDESFQQCPAYFNHQDFQLIHGDLQDIKSTVKEMKEILDAWEDAKAFFKIIKIIGEALKWIVAVSISIGLIWYFITGKDRK